MAEARLADIGEAELIRRLGAFAPPGQFDDDAALLPLAAMAGGATGDLVLNTDVLVEGVHFSEATTGPADVGWRAAAANLSDLAAMGCTEVVGLTVGLVAPSSTPWRWVEGVYSGLAAALATYGGQLLGGDCSGGDQRMLAVSAVGRLAAATGVIRRGDGRPGDQLVATGPHGLSRLGLALLQDSAAGRGLDPALAERAITAHRRPRPRFDAVRALHVSQPPIPWRVGGCDSSDGLAAAAAAIATASGCAGRLDHASLPLAPGMEQLPAAEGWCLGGGEDFELVLALEPPWATALVASLPGASVVGTLATGTPGQLTWSDGRPLPPEAGPGYSHYR